MTDNGKYIVFVLKSDVDMKAKGMFICLTMKVISHIEG